jgi:hypothetical protein
MSAQFERHTLAVQHQGKVYYVSLPDEVWPLLMQLVCSMSKDEKLQLVEAPEGTKFADLSEILK